MSCASRKWTLQPLSHHKTGIVKFLQTDTSFKRNWRVFRVDALLNSIDFFLSVKSKSPVSGQFHVLLCKSKNFVPHPGQHVHFL